MASQSLQSPALPTEASWGDRTLLVSVAGLDFRINGLNIVQRQALNNLYASFPAYGGESVLDTWVFKGGFPERGGAYFSGKGSVYTPRIQRSKYGIAVEGVGFQATIDFTPRLQATLRANDGELLVTRAVFENYLRIFAAYAVLMRGGLLLHSSGIVVDGQAYLFLGRSGAGKTTLSRLALIAGAKVLSDDINILIPDEQGGFSASAVPFAGELGHDSIEQSGRYPLKGMFWLEKAPLLYRETMPEAMQFAKLLACCPIVNTDPHQMDRILASGVSLLQNTPMQLLHFRRDEIFSEICEILSAQVDGELQNINSRMGFGLDKF